MSGTARRRALRLALALLLFLLVWAGGEFHRLTLGHPAFYNGWFLLAAMVVLALYGLRRRLPALPLGRASHWLQVHIYLGAVAFGLFLIHMRSYLPHDPLERALLFVFVITMVSGVAGIWIDRSIARRLGRSGGEIVYERIPDAIVALREEAEADVLDVAEATASRVFADHYVRHVAVYLDGVSDRWRHLLGLGTTAMALDRDLARLRRYVGDEEGQGVERLRARIARKATLDRQAALQLAMRAWLLVHGPAVVVLVALTVAHVVVVYAFAGAQ